MQTITSGEAELVAALRAGEGDAFAALMKTQSSTLLRTARRFLRSEEDARDAVQDAYIALFKSIGAFESNAKVATWLHRILINCCLMRLRSRRRHKDVDIDHVLPWAESAEAILQRGELRNIVRSSIDSLPERYRIVLVLRDIEELGTDEVAKLLATTPNAVKVRLHRARQALRTLLDPYMRCNRAA